MAKTSVKKGQKDDFVSVSRQEFEQFKQWQEEVADVAAIIKRGRVEFKNGLTTVAPSPRVFR